MDGSENTRERKHYQPLDGLRGMAILLVLVVHCFWYQGPSRIGTLLSTIALAGWVGVVLFFVLSGFLITGILIDTRNEPNYYRDFYARRSLRIFPLYFAFLTIYTFVTPHVPRLIHYWPQPDTRTLLFDWFYLANMQEWLSHAHVVGGPLDALWSLSVEEQVYLFWPLLIAWAPSRTLGKVFGALVIVSFAWRFGTRLAGQSIELGYCWAPANIEAFAAGGLVAHMARRCPASLNRFATRVFLTSTAFVAGMCIGMRHFAFWRSPAEVLTFGISGTVWLFASVIALCIGSAPSSFLNRVLSVRPLRAVGGYSYAIYVFHLPIVALLRPTVCNGDCSKSVARGLALLLTVTCCSFACAFASWHTWEKHFLRLKRFFPSTGRAVPLAVGTDAGHAKTSRENTPTNETPRSNS